MRRGGLNPGPAWNAEFMRMQQMAHPAVRAHQHHDAAFEHEWHSQFDSIAGDAKGKAAAPTASTQQQQQQQYPAQHVHGDLDAWSEEFAKVNLSDTGALADWQREFENFDLEGVTDEREREELMNKMAEVWRELQKQNEEIDARGAAAGSDLANPWDGGYEDFLNRNENGAFSDPDPVTAPWTEYKFEPNNPFLGRPDALEMGLQILQSPDGSLSQAALAFEAAVQANHANNSDAWMHLGKVQAENEKEDAAIIALQKSVQLNPQNLPALMVRPHLFLYFFYSNAKIYYRTTCAGLLRAQSLAVSYTNEGKEFQAYATLNRWLTTKYPSIPEAAQPQAPLSQAGGGGAFMSSYEVHDATTARYLQAVQTSLGGGGGVPGVGVDADLQLGLGVLFYNRGEFDKVIDCFSAALRVRADDYLLWNRLGATLANSGRSEEAIEAYRKALELKPSFVRCRYNLGVSCINIGCYREAAEHLLGALSLHNVGDDEAAAVNVSENLWDTLRRAFVQMRRMDLADMADKNRNVDQFRKEFEF
ncbi:Peroxisomal membrane signal receptor PTS1 [Entophlyctis luteolus]|nr:Peroxisomal membrane signal receptor PTS1 [Entophlyctis luteolus]